MSEQVVKRYGLGENLCTVSGDPLPKRVVAEEDYDALHAEAEALRAENGRLARQKHEADTALAYATRHYESLSADLEAARGLLRDMRHAARVRPSCQAGIVNPCRCMGCVYARTAAFLTATPAPEAQNHTERNLEMARQALLAENQRVVPPEPIIAPPHPFDKPSLLKDCNVTYSNSSRPLAEHGERQEAVAWGAFHFGGSRNGKLYAHCETQEQIESYIADLHRSNDCITLRKGPLYTTPQPGPDVRGLVSADDVRDACANAVSVFAEETNAAQCREVAEYMREVLLAQIARRQDQPQ